MTKKLNRVLTLVLTFMALMAGQTAWAADDWTVTNPTGSKFRITRPTSHVGTTETVKYRTVSLSAYAGQHYTAVSSDVAFGVNDTYKEVTVTENSPTTDAYKYQTGTKRKYRFDVTDQGGFHLAHCDREITTGTKFSADKVSKSITNLVYFNSSGNYTSGVSSSKYMDVSYTPPSSQVETSGTLSGYVLIDDSYDYANKAATVSTSDLINTTGTTAAYLNTLEYKIYATVCFTEKERDDGYQYIQIIAGNGSAAYDTGYDPEGSVNNPVNSVYKTCFELSDGSNAEGKQYFPHRYSYANKAAETKASISITEFSQTNGKLWQQKFKSGYQATSSGSLIFDANVGNITTRFDAGGDNDDTWGYKDLFVRMALVDATAPTVSDISVASGYHAKGNTVYVSVAFNEIVTGSSAKLTSNWGDLSYVDGSGSNVLTFCREIPASASSSLNITGCSGITDLAGNAPSSVSSSGLCSVDASFAYTITYNLNDGSVTTANTTSYTWETATFTLNNPTKLGYYFNGWTGSNGNTPNTTVTIANHSHGNKSYTANWTDVWGVESEHDGTTAEKAYTITTTQGLDLLAQYVNSGNNCKNLYFQLGGPIEYTHTTAWNVASNENNYTAIGTNSNPFQGTFDGNNNTVSGIRIYSDNDEKGLFGKVSSGGTVKRVNLSNARITGIFYVGGIASSTYQAAIEDCTVGDDVCIHTVADYASYHGGIVGLNQSPISRCISRARLTVADGKTGCKDYGGIAGYNNHGTITDCIADGVVIPDVNGRGAITGYQYNGSTLTRNYYHNCKVASESVTSSGVGMGNSQDNKETTDVTTNQGALPLYAVTLPDHTSLVRTPATNPTLPGTGNATYISGADIAGVPYAIAGATLNLSYRIAALTEGYSVTISAAQTTGGASVAVTDNGDYTYIISSMPAADVTIAVTPTNVWGVSADIDGSTAEKAYTISDTRGLDLLATLVNNGEFRNFEGKFFKLGDDITYSHGNSDTENNYTAIGDYNHPFCGTFDGQGKTVRGIRIYKDGTTNADNYQGLFGETLGATIKNVILADARITGKRYVGGIAGYISANNGQGGIVENCRVGSDVTIHAVANSAGSHGGVVGNCNGGTISGCVSAATLTVANGLTNIHYYGGIVGRLSGNISDCLAIGTTVPAVNNLYGAIVGYVNSGTHTNNYHHGCTVGGNAAQSDTYNVSAYTISAGTNVTMTPTGNAAQTYEYKGIQRYGNALYYGGKFYAPEAADVSFTLDYPVPAGLTIGYAATAGTLNLTPNPSPSGEGSYTLTVPAEDVTINATLSLKYIAANGTEQTCTDFTLIQSSNSYVSLGTSANNEAWYVVSGEVTINGKLYFNDQAVHLILCDGASLSATSNNNDGISSEYGLTIYGQSQQSGTLNARSNGSNSGIYVNSDDFTVNGGNITATSKNQRGIYVRSGSVTINRGSVTATSEGTDHFAYGIYSSNVTINGGTVSATGGENGILASSGKITLGYTNPTDHIYASSYSHNPTVKSGQTLTDGSAAYSDNVSNSAINDKTLWPDLWDVAGGNDGSTAAKAYTITTTGGLDLLAAQVNSSNDYNNFEGKFFRLGDDITYSHTTDWNDATSEENNYIAIGTNETPFCGTFDGQGKKVSGIRIYKGKVRYQGLFGMAVGATIKNVSLTDARITGGQFVGGIAGHLDGTVENCRVGSDVTIHAVANSANYHGGVVGLVYDGNISGCVSAATLTVANNLTGTNSYGGIVGVLGGNMSDCLALGASVPNVTGQGAIIGNFASKGTKRPSSTNNYHHGCTVDGNAAPNNKRNVSAYTISAGTNVTVAPAGDADATYLHNGIQRYGDALYYNGVIYVPTTAAGNDFSLTLGNTGTPATGFVFNGYTATAGTLNLTPDPSPSGEGSYTLTMPAEDVTINAKLAVPYIDENGEEQICRDYTLITSSDETFCNYGNGDQTNWYVVSGDVTINGQLCFRNSYSHLIVCDGASLSVSSSYDAIYGSNGSLTIYGQGQGGGTITANGGSHGIIVDGTITINGCTVSATGNYGINGNRGITINRGTVTATCDGGCGIFGYNVTINGGNVSATGGDKGIYAIETITLGWTDPTDRITASSYAINYENGVAIKVKSGQTMTDGSAAYSETLNSDQIAALAGKTLWSDLWGVASGNDGSTAEKAYTISDSWGLDQLAAQVNSSNDYNNFEGKFFRLGGPITYTHTTDWNDATSEENNYTAIGGYYNGGDKYFCGTFDGQGYTISGIRIYKAGTTNADNYQGLFGETLGATIKNVILADARITGMRYVGGIAGYITKNNNQGGIVENCRVGSDVTIHAVANSAGSHGGVVGDCNGGTISGCVSAATLTVANGLTNIHYYGGIVGFLNGNISDCLAIGTTVPAVNNLYGAIVGYVNSGTHTNNYHRDCTVGDATHQSDAYTVSAGTDVTVAPAGDAAQTYKYDGIKRYGTAYDGNALYYDGVIYVPTAVAGNDITLSVLGAEYVSGGITYSPTAYNVEYNDGTAQSFSINPDANGQATFQMPAFDAEVVASATGPVAVTYIDENGTEQRKAYAEVTFLESSTGSTVSLGKMDEEHWFAASGNVSITNTGDGALSFKGAARLILCDGASLTLSGSWPLKVFGNLVIYGQSQGTGSLAAEGSAAIKVDSYGTIDDNGTLTINGGNVTAHSTGSNGITSDNSVTINGGTVRATSGDQFGNGISSVDGDVTINGGNVTATGGDRNPGILTNGTITLGWTSATDRIKASSYSASTISVKSGQTLYNDFTALKGNITVSEGDLRGKTLEPGIPFIVDNYILLDDDSQQPTGYKNADRLAALNFGSACDIMLYGRTLYRDGDWNTLCLPFNISGEEIEYEYYNNPLHGATIMYFDDRYWHDTGSEVSDSYADGLHRSGEVEDGSLHLYFNNENCINAGDPYIVKWETTGDPIVNPVFKDVVVANTIPYDWHTTEEGPGNVTFRGTYSPIKYESDNHSILFLGAENTLYWPKKGAHIGAFRAYFELGNGITVGEEASQVRSFNLGFGEESDETGIDSMHNSECLMLNEADAWYSLDGRKLDGKPNAKGMYIKNGKKVVIK